MDRQRTERPEREERIRECEWVRVEAAEAETGGKGEQANWKRRGKGENQEWATGQSLRSKSKESVIQDVGDASAAYTS